MYEPGQLYEVTMDNSALWDKAEDPKYRRRRELFAPEHLVDNVMGQLKKGDLVTLVDVQKQKIRVKVISQFGVGWVMRYYLRPVR